MDISLDRLTCPRRGLGRLLAEAPQAGPHSLILRYPWGLALGAGFGEKSPPTVGPSRHGAQSPQVRKEGMTAGSILLTAQGRWETGAGPGDGSRARPGAHRRQDGGLWEACLGPPPASRSARELSRSARAGREG